MSSLGQEEASAKTPLAEVVELLEQVRIRLPGLKSERTVEELRRRLRSATPSQELMLLMIIDLDLVESVIPELLELASRHRYTELIPQIFARFPKIRRERILNFAVLGPSLDGADDDHYRRLAELFYELRQDAELEFLVRRALVSEDVYIREVGEDYSEGRTREDSRDLE